MMKRQIEILEAAYQRSQDEGTPCIELTPAAVKSTISNLFGLKHSGEMMKIEFEKAQNAEKGIDSQETIIVPRSLSLYSRGRQMVGKAINRLRGT